MGSVELFGLTWVRPWGAAALVVPLVVWWLAARSGRGDEVWTGTLAVWREAVGPVEPQQRRARRLPWAVRLLVAALAAAAMALAGPHTPGSSGDRAWIVVVDRSPSMYLPWLPAEGDPDRQGTRLERALERARELLAQAGAEGDPVRWVSYDDGQPTGGEGQGFPREWLAPPREQQKEPPWSAHDVAGSLWLSDAEPGTSARQAGLALSGGDAVPGPVAALGTSRVEWDGERLVERSDAGPRPVVVLSAEVTGPVGRVVRAWAEARGCEVSEESGSEDVVLEVSQPALPPGGGALLSGAAGRDGWVCEALFEPTPDPLGGEVWLATTEGVPLVVWRRGHCRLPFRGELREPQGDPADFALSWAGLLDRAALAPTGVVALNERRAAGRGFGRAPLPPRPSGTSTAGAWGASLAALAAALGLAALSTRRRQPAGSPGWGSSTAP